MRGHIVLCGLGQVGWRVLEYLQAAQADLIVVDNRVHPGDPRLKGAEVVVGDCRHRNVLEQARLDEARGVLIMLSDDLHCLSAALLAKQIHPPVRVVVRMFNDAIVSRLGNAAGNIHALSTSRLAAPLLALIARTGRTLGHFNLGDDTHLQLSELTIVAESTLPGQTLASVAGTYGVTVVAHMPAGQPARLIHDVDHGATLQAGDRMVVCCTDEPLHCLLADAEMHEAPDLRWSNAVLRWLRSLRRAVALIDLPVKVTSSAFALVIFVSILVFHFGMRNDTLIDAFYRTVSLLATGADMKGEQVEAGSWQKAFISGLRLMGVALTASFTAILANYLLRARLGGALEIRRIPDRGHIVVCGLGNIGMRVVEELRAQEESVVVIEMQGDNPFVPVARRLGAAVMIGNATLLETLRQANAARARAVIAATSRDLVNLEVALLVRELSADQRVVVRLTDAFLANLLRQAANVRLALSIPDLAAPAFIARLYGDQVHSLLQIEGRMIAVYDLLIQEPTTIATVQALHRCGVIHRAGADGAALSVDAGQEVRPGERLSVIIPFESLERLQLAR